MQGSSLAIKLLSESTVHMALSFDLFKQFSVSHLDTIKHIVYNIIVVSVLIFCDRLIKITYLDDQGTCRTLVFYVSFLT